MIVHVRYSLSAIFEPLPMITIFIRSEQKFSVESIERAGFTRLQVDQVIVAVVIRWIRRSIFDLSNRGIARSKIVTYRQTHD